MLSQTESSSQGLGSKGLGSTGLGSEAGSQKLDVALEEGVRSRAEATTGGGAEGVEAAAEHDPLSQAESKREQGAQSLATAVNQTALSQEEIGAKEVGQGAGVAETAESERDKEKQQVSLFGLPPGPDFGGGRIRGVGYSSQTGCPFGEAYLSEEVLFFVLRWSLEKVHPERWHPL